MADEVAYKSSEESNGSNVDMKCGSSDEYVPSSRQSSSEESKEPIRVKRKKSNPGNWKKNDRKTRKNSGNAFTSSTGQTVIGKTLKDYRCTCSRKCYENVSLQDRQLFFDMYYSGGRYETQTALIGRYVKSFIVKDRRSNAEYPLRITCVTKQKCFNSYICAETMYLLKLYFTSL
ncbi:uncharacterized protein LOC126281498 [Schistocerca gregaria]|uniref:uncharacterized protein LOC126281498 n=1 Tax=Schistocerca gregaria TaxID=7010 RepID=UPI00211EA0F4|nr:uncharacterized protein LOC126281498 [Schistocerca gregaria]